MNFTSKRADLTKDESFGYSTTPTILPTSTARRYLVPTALGASRRCVSAVFAVAVIIVVVGAAAATGLGVAAPTAAAAAFFFTVLFRGPEEQEVVPIRRVVAAGGGADLLFQGGIGSIPGEALVTAALRFLLEQESEVLVIGFGLVVFGDDPEIELPCIPVQRSERFVRCRRVVLRRRFPALRNRVKGGGGGALRRRGRRIVDEVGAG